MKVRVSMTGAAVSVEMEEKMARRTFQRLAERLMVEGLMKTDKTEEPEVPELQQAEEVLPEESFGPAQEPESVKTEMEPLEETAPPNTPSGYGGYLYIKCPDCGKVKGFCAKTRIGNFRCGCGSVTKLQDLVPMYVRCECGRSARYLTNMTEPVFDIDCYDCGSPVAVQWNDKKRQYETIR